MQTYKTINEAFKNGKGDVFFYNRDKEYVCVSRKDADSMRKLEDEGFTMMTYNEVVETAKAQSSPVVEERDTTVETVAKVSKMVKSYDNISNGRDGYYDEFPDACNQSL